MISDLHLARYIAAGYERFRQSVLGVQYQHCRQGKRWLCFLGTNEMSDLRWHFDCRNFLGVHRGWRVLVGQIEYLGRNVDCFAGHSFGAAIAAIMAARWKKDAVLFAPPKFCTRVWAEHAQRNGTNFRVYRIRPSIVEYAFPGFAELPGRDYIGDWSGAARENHSMPAIIARMEQDEREKGGES